MRRFLNNLIWISSILVFATISASGQDFDQVCRALFNTAFNDLSQNCAGLANDSVCFGYGSVTADFVDINGNPIADADAPLQFAGSQTPLYDSDTEALLRRIQTVPFNPFLLDGTVDGIHTVQAGDNLFRIAMQYGVDLEELVAFNSIDNRSQIFVGQEILIPGIYDPEATPEEIQERIDRYANWGIASIYSMASYGPDSTITEPPANFLIFGDVTVTDGTPIENVFLPKTTISVALNDAELYIAPPDYLRPHMLVDTISGEYVADAISPDGTWVRINYGYDGRFGTQSWAWVATSALSVTPDNLAELAVFSPESASPMQRVEIEMGERQISCEGDKTSGVIVQTRAGYETDIVVNDVTIRLSSTIYIEVLPSGDLRIIALEGVIQLNPDGDPQEPVVLIPGFSVDAVYQCPDATEGECSAETEGSQLVLQDPVIQDISTLDTINAVIVGSSSAENVVNAIPSVTTVTSSGEGGAEPAVAISDPEDAAYIASLCQQGALPDYICNSVNQ